jgi:hypothetical protein
MLELPELRYEDYDCGIGRYVHANSDIRGGTFWTEPCPRKSVGGALIHTDEGQPPMPIPICREHLDAFHELGRTEPASEQQVLTAAIHAMATISEQWRGLN